MFCIELVARSVPRVLSNLEKCQAQTVHYPVLLSPLVGDQVRVGGAQEARLGF